MHTLRRARVRRPSLWPALRQALRASSTSTATPNPISSILIANRGEIALRVGRTAAAHGIRVTTVYTNPDAHSQHATSSPSSVNLGDASGYLDGERILRAARAHGAQAVHPGYGFLSENAGFARRCAEEGITFIGPPWRAIEAMGSKSASKDIMTAAGVPCIPGYHGERQDPEGLREEAAKVGYPVLLKAVKGGGGKGMRIVRTEDEFLAQLESARTEARNSFGDDVMLVEKYITRPRHIEVQVFADKHGNCVALGERDCSVQRRHQKILEESPAPDLDDVIRKDLWEKARAAALAVKYEGAGTVEFIFDNDTNEFFFMEMNTRLQVEHPVTEMVTGEDLVRWQIIVAEGGVLPLTQDQVEQQISQRGHAIEARIYAENPDMNFMPDSGKLIHLQLPPLSETVRVDAGFVAGDEVSAHYDPMIAKLIVRAPDRRAALQKLRAALEQYEIAGPATNIEFLKRLCASPAFIAGEVETGYIDKHREELFHKADVAPEVLAQTAIGLLLEERRAAAALGPDALAPSELGGAFRARSWSLAELAPDGTAGSPTAVDVQEHALDRLTVRVGASSFDVTLEPGAAPGSFATYFPATRLETTLVRDGDRVTVWQLGRQHRFQLAAPAWMAKALGVKEAAHGVRAPMPCKVLRVDVEVGDAVAKGQVVATVESMKMEMTIRSPRDGVISKVVHQAGDMCKAGTPLVEFEGS